jgi:DNA-3-methyladenine glycosylase II
MAGKNWEIREAYHDLEKDPVIGAVIKLTGKLEHLPERDLYEALLSSIISQQLSTKAANTIYSRFREIFGGTPPSPEQLINTPAEMMRSTGISFQKAGYLHSIARFAAEGKLEAEKINRMTDDELVEYLTFIKGVGRWTAEMILIFSMNRPDVFPVDDLGVRQSVLNLYGLPDHGKITSAGLIQLSEGWRPWRSLVSRHLWHLRDKHMNEK